MPPLFMQQLKSFSLFICFLFLHTSCSLFHSKPEPAANRSSSSRPTAKAPVKTAGKVVDSKSYQQRYAREVVNVARSYTGTPYRSGGNTSSGIDCSGLLYAAFSTVGLKMPRISWQQSEIGYEVEVDDIRPGDLLFFVPDKGKAGYVSHTGLVTEVRGRGNIRFIHASSSRGVREDNLYTDYFKGRFVKAVRPF